DPDYLYLGTRLQAAREWEAANPGDANPAEHAFLAASVAAQERTLGAARRTARRMQSLAAGLAVVLAAALAATGLAVAGRHEADSQAELAQAAARAAQSSRLATLARTLDRDQIDAALLLGVAGYRAQPSIETEGSLETALVHTPAGLERVVRFGSPAFYPS